MGGGFRRHGGTALPRAHAGPQARGLATGEMTITGLVAGRDQLGTMAGSPRVMPSSGGSGSPII
jgi:hypothetical protein